MLIQHRSQSRCPPCWVSKILQSALRQRSYLVSALRKLHQHGEVSVQLSHKVLLCSPLISVNAHQLYSLVARVALQVLLLSQIGRHSRRVSPHQIVETVGRQLVLQHVPQRLILFSRTQLLAPPEPATCVLVPWTEYHWYLHTVFVLKCSQEVAHALHPLLKQLMLCSALKYALHHGSVAHVPCCSLWEFLSGQSAAFYRCQRVAWVPANCYYTATLIMLYYLLRHASKRHAVQVLLVAHLNAAQFKSHHSRPVATGILHVAAVGHVIPCQPIERIVLMSKHITIVTQSVQSHNQLVSHRSLHARFLLSRAADNHHRPHSDSQ